MTHKVAKRGIESRLLVILTAITILLFVSLQVLSDSDSNANIVPYGDQQGVVNIQASYPITAGATDRSGVCVSNAQYNNHHSESWIVVDPTNPQHLVAMSKFFFDPSYYLFHVGAYVSTDGGQDWKDAIVPGFDCQSAPSNSWVDTTDPVLAFDSQGNVYSAMLAFSFNYDLQGHQVYGAGSTSAIFVVKSLDGGETWTLANQGNALATFAAGSTGMMADRQWIAVDSNPRSALTNNVYVGWTVVAGNTSEIWFSHSSDQATHFSNPTRLTNPDNDGPSNQYLMMGSGPDGALYAAYTSLPVPSRPTTDVWVLKSSDGGQTFFAPMLAARINAVSTGTLANTSFRHGIPNSFAVNPTNGHLLLALEVENGNGVDIQLTESRDGGTLWTSPVYVNDPSTTHDGTDQFQPTVSVSQKGIVAVAFYDRRLPCPNGDPGILPPDTGRTNFCTNTSIQFYKDAPQTLRPIGSNIRVSTATWDPQNPGDNSQLPSPSGPTSTLTFIGDYFGLALSNSVAYVLSASNHDGGLNPAHEQQQILGIVSIPQ